jgi:hypothetical protein
LCFLILFRLFFIAVFGCVLSGMLRKIIWELLEFHCANVYFSYCFGASDCHDSNSGKCSFLHFFRWLSIGCSICVFCVFSVTRWMARAFEIDFSLWNFHEMMLEFVYILLSVKWEGEKWDENIRKQNWWQIATKLNTDVTVYWKYEWLSWLGKVPAFKITRTLNCVVVEASDKKWFWYFSSCLQIFREFQLALHNTKSKSPKLKPQSIFLRCNLQSETAFFLSLED